MCVQIIQESDFSTNRTVLNGSEGFNISEGFCLQSIKKGLYNMKMIGTLNNYKLIIFILKSPK